MGQTPRSRSQGKKERSYHKETHVKYQSSSTHCSKVNSKVKVLEGGQNDRQDKNNMPPDLRSRGHKNNADKNTGSLTLIPKISLK